MLKRPPFLVALCLALLASASTWFYINKILRAQQIAEAVQHNKPRGNLSDLYPRWLGARELLLHRRNPYSSELTREIQQGYYGRPLDPVRPDDPKDQQGFAYPAYVVFLLAPTVSLPFDTVQTGFRWLLFALAAGSILLWLRVLHWKALWPTKIVLIILVLGWLPMVQGIKLQQLSLVVAALLALCGACLEGGWLFCAGGLLALATIKPQLTWPMVLWLLIWAGSDWRSRRRLALGFGLVLLLLLGGAELILPGWVWLFIDGLGKYHQYVQNQSLLAVLFGLVPGRILGVMCVLACALCVHDLRGEQASSARFGEACAMVLALTIVIAPMSALYNQVLLLPAILALVHSWARRDPILPAVRLARVVGGVLLFWPWIASAGLSAAYLWLTPAVRERVWAMPLYSSLMFPIFAFGLALLDTWMNSQRNLRDGAPAE